MWKFKNIKVLVIITCAVLLIHFGLKYIFEKPIFSIDNPKDSYTYGDTVHINAQVLFAWLIPSEYSSEHSFYVQNLTNNRSILRMRETHLLYVSESNQKTAYPFQKSSLSNSIDLTILNENINCSMKGIFQEQFINPQCQNSIIVVPWKNTMKLSVGWYEWQFDIFVRP